MSGSEVRSSDVERQPARLATLVMQCHQKSKALLGQTKGWLVDRMKVLPGDQKTVLAHYVPEDTAQNLAQQLPLSRYRPLEEEVSFLDGRSSLAPQEPQDYRPSVQSSATLLTVHCWALVKPGATRPQLEVPT